jgi:hypothetical protein
LASGPAPPSPRPGTELELDRLAHRAKSGLDVLEGRLDPTLDGMECAGELGQDLPPFRESTRRQAEKRRAAVHRVAATCQVTQALEACEPVRQRARLDADEAGERTRRQLAGTLELVVERRVVRRDR